MGRIGPKESTRGPQSVKVYFDILFSFALLKSSQNAWARNSTTGSSTKIVLKDANAQRGVFRAFRFVLQWECDVPLVWRKLFTISRWMKTVDVHASEKNALNCRLRLVSGHLPVKIK